MSDDDWDTGADMEAPQDKYNKTSFSGSGDGPKAPEVVKASIPESSPVVVKPPSPPSAEAAVAKKESSSRRSSTASTRRKSSVKTDTAPPVKEMASLRVKTPPSGAAKGNSNAFTALLDAESLAFFNEVTEKPFSEQAVQFLNAYWHEVGDQADFIFTCAWETIKYADMHTKGVNYIHLYDEGNSLDFNIGLYFYEKLCKKVLEDKEGKKWRDDPKYALSMPTMMTAIKRKQELRDKVDVNFDGRVSFLEYLLYQYRDHTNPAEFTHRAMKAMEMEEHPELVKARTALDEVNNAIREYEKEKKRLEEASQQPGVKGLSAKHQLSILNASPLAENLNTALIKAEAAVRIATKKFGSAAFKASVEGGSSKPTDGSIWWMNRDLQEKKLRYGKKSK